MHTPQVGDRLGFFIFDSRMSIPRLAQGVKVRGFHLGASYCSLCIHHFDTYLLRVITDFSS